MRAHVGDRAGEENRAAFPPWCINAGFPSLRTCPWVQEDSERKEGDMECLHTAEAELEVSVASPCAL